MLIQKKIDGYPKIEIKRIKLNKRIYTKEEILLIKDACMKVVNKGFNEVYLIGSWANNTWVSKYTSSYIKNKLNKYKLSDFDFYVSDDYQERFDNIDILNKHRGNKKLIYKNEFLL